MKPEEEKHMKKILSLCLAAAFLIVSLSVLVQPALATANGTCGENLTWTLDENGVLTISGSGDMYDFDSDNMPWADYEEDIKFVEIEDGVTSIGDFAFFSLGAMADISIANSVASIGEQALSFCASLTAVKLPEGLTSISDGLFFWCENLVAVEIPDSVTSIGMMAFSMSEKLTDVKLPSGLTSIGMEAFYCCNLTSVVIPNTLTSIGDSAFSSCSNLTSVMLQDGLTSIGSSMFSGCTALTEIVIPDSVTSIGAGAFFNCTALTSITIPEGVTTIGQIAFRGCSGLADLVIPASVTTIERMAFWACSSMTQITFLGDAPSIGENVFYEVTATAYYPADNETWTEDVMRDYGGTITWKEAEKEVVILASGTCGENLTWTLTEDGVLIITGTGPMYDYGIQGNGESAPWSAYAAEIKELVITNLVTKIGHEAFRGCTVLTEFVVPTGLKSLGYRAFAGCTGLRSVTIARYTDVLAVSADVFLDCTNLTDIYLKSEVMNSVVTKQWFDHCRLLDYAERIYVGSYIENVTTVISNGFACDNVPQTVELDGIAYNMYTKGTHSYQTTVKEPTCTEDGSVQRRCEVCDYLREEYVDATGHNWNENYICLTCGYAAVYVADVGLVMEDLVVIDGIYYTAEGKPVVIAVDAPIEWLGGNSLKDYVELYGDEYLCLTYWDLLVGMMNEEGFVPLTDETILWILDVITGNPRWEEDESYLPRYLGIHLVRDQEHEHQYFAIATEATCTEAGYTTYVCRQCGCSYTADPVAAKGHSFADGECTECGATAMGQGDVNGDGKVDTTDAKLIMQFDLGIAGETALDLSLADVNGDGKADTTDAKLVMQLDLGLIEQFP